MEPNEKVLIRVVAHRLRSFTTRLFLREMADRHFGIPMDLSDAQALRIFARAIEAVEGEI